MNIEHTVDRLEELKEEVEMFVPDFEDPRDAMKLAQRVALWVDVILAELKADGQ